MKNQTSLAQLGLKSLGTPKQQVKIILRNISVIREKDAMKRHVCIVYDESEWSAKIESQIYKSCV